MNGTLNRRSAFFIAANAPANTFAIWSPRRSLRSRKKPRRAGPNVVIVTPG
jgi:hypothetical protein